MTVKDFSALFFDSQWSANHHECDQLVQVPPLCASSQTWWTSI